MKIPSLILNLNRPLSELSKPVNRCRDVRLRDSELVARGCVKRDGILGATRDRGSAFVGAGVYSHYPVLAPTLAFVSGVSTLSPGPPPLRYPSAKTLRSRRLWPPFASLSRHLSQPVLQPPRASPCQRRVSPSWLRRCSRPWPVVAPFASPCPLPLVQPLRAAALAALAVFAAPARETAWYFAGAPLQRKRHSRPLREGLRPVPKPTARTRGCRCVSPRRRRGRPSAPCPQSRLKRVASPAPFSLRCVPAARRTSARESRTWRPRRRRCTGSRSWKPAESGTPPSTTPAWCTTSS